MRPGLRSRGAQSFPGSAPRASSTSETTDHEALTMARQRYDHARELRAYADRFEAAPSITHRVSAESAHATKADIIKDMRRRADELVRMDEPRAETVFTPTRNGKSAGGGRFVAEIRS